MARHTILILAGLIFNLTLAPCRAEDDVETLCARSDQACWIKSQRANPAKSMAHWVGALQRPLDERITPAPPEIVRYVTIDNIANGFAPRPRRALVSTAFLADVRDAINELPERVRAAVAQKLVAIFLVDGLGSTGFSDSVNDAQGHPVAGFVILDAGVLFARPANEWASWKESSPFKSDSGFSIAATIEEAAHNTRKNAIQYILLHEFGHVLSIASNIHPPWDQPIGASTSLVAYPFAMLSWQTNPAPPFLSTRFDDRFELRRQVVYYLGARLGSDQIVPTYRWLETTNFPTLYAATNPFDDFAESFANYVHTVLLKRPFLISVMQGGDTVMVYQSCWQEERCAAKRELLERFLKDGHV
jgi:hypothetical protein